MSFQKIVGVLRLFNKVKNGEQQHNDRSQVWIVFINKWHNRSGTSSIEK